MITKNNIFEGLKFDASNYNFIYKITDLIYPYVVFIPLYKEDESFIPITRGGNPSMLKFNNGIYFENDLYHIDIELFLDRINKGNYKLILRNRNLDILLN